jgi:hypothetical protein
MEDGQLNGMHLPSRLMAALGDGTWAATGKHWKAVFPADEIVLPKLYSRRLMQLCNGTWSTETHPAFVGVADGRATPGYLDPARSLLIGELQGDAMIALDYRGDDDAPSVAYLNLEGRWSWLTMASDPQW